MYYTKEIETPIGKHTVLVKTLLSGLEREVVTSAPQEFVRTTDGKAFEVVDMKKMGLAEKHALLRVSVISIDGDATDCFDRLQRMFEPDYAFVYDQLLEIQKKMMLPTSQPS